MDSSFSHNKICLSSLFVINIASIFRTCARHLLDWLSRTFSCRFHTFAQMCTLVIVHVATRGGKNTCWLQSINSPSGRMGNSSAYKSTDTDTTTTASYTPQNLWSLYQRRISTSSGASNPNAINNNFNNHEREAKMYICSRSVLMKNVALASITFSRPKALGLRLAVKIYSQKTTTQPRQVSQPANQTCALLCAQCACNNLPHKNTSKYPTNIEHRTEIDWSMRSPRHLSACDRTLGIMCSKKEASHKIKKTGAINWNSLPLASRARVWSVCSDGWGTWRKLVFQWLIALTVAGLLYD